jgi:hypothetical protein
MYHGYCFVTIGGHYTPKVRLETPEECFGYCTLQSQLFPEIRITDEDDCCVMHMRNHILKVPFPDNTFRWFHLRENREITEAEQW